MFIYYFDFFRLNGSYEALEYGFEADAFTDMTGGLAEWYNPAHLNDTDFYLIRAAFTSGAVIGCLSVVSIFAIRKQKSSKNESE